MGLEATGNRRITTYKHGTCSFSIVSFGDLDFVGKLVFKTPPKALFTGRRLDLTIQSKGSVISLLNFPT